jgi:hypothetical protein
VTVIAWRDRIWTTQRQRRWWIGIVGDEPEPVTEPEQHSRSHQANDATFSRKPPARYEQTDHARSGECGEATNGRNEAYPDATESTNQASKPGTLHRVALADTRLAGLKRFVSP